MYAVEWTKKALSQLRKLPHLIVKRILLAIDVLSADPASSHIKKLSGYPFYRLRVGDYRIIFDLQEKRLIIYILEVGHRTKISRRY